MREFKRIFLAEKSNKTNKKNFKMLENKKFASPNISLAYDSYYSKLKLGQFKFIENIKDKTID